MKDTQKSAKSTTTADEVPKGFTDEERAAMKERAQELKAEGAAAPVRARTSGRGRAT